MSQSAQAYVVPPQTTAVTVRSKGKDAKAISKSFFQEMDQMMKDYADPAGTVTLFGIVFEGDDKYGVACTTAINEWQSRMSSAIETIFSIKDFIKKLEETISKY